ncbi:MAG: hypothetical protein ACTSYD_14795 [Candidatus Heimdallarchaeaceae archaeon]
MKFAIFVTGLLKFDSGKTTFISDLLAFIQEHTSLSVVPFKPLSGNNLFYHYREISKMSSTQKNFVSIDIIKLLDSINNKPKIPLVLFNPVHQIFTPALAAEFYREGTLHTYLSKNMESIALLQRFTQLRKEEPFTTYLVNEKIWQNPKFWTPITVIEDVLRSANEVKLYSSETEYYSLNGQYYATSVQSTFEFIKNHYDIVIIESFNNAAHPAWCVREAKIVFSVGPGSVFVYDSKDFFTAVDSYKMIQRNSPSTTSEIMKLAKPIKASKLPIDAKERMDIISNLVEEILNF